MYKIGAVFLLSAVILIFAISFGSAVEASVCCAKTIDGLSCQNVPQSQCPSGSQQAPTSCESTSFCKPGVCYSPNEGTCLDNVPRDVCNVNNGTWSETSPAQCSLGCCVLGDQAAFVSLVRCKKLSGFLGLETNFNNKITNEVQCVLSVQNQDKGACVYEKEFENACLFTTKANCDSGIDGTGKGTFYKDKLCTDPELNTICGKTDETTCVPGKEGVYFVDTCGNPANIYDASKINDDAYWKNVVRPEESCNLGTGNSKSCGNCNYLKGTVCRQSETGNRANYGDNICTNLNCVDSAGKARKHGESWCANDVGKKDSSKNNVGSRFFRHLCLNGEEVVEACEDFRQEECIEDKLVTSEGEFSQAACRVNRWQDCTSQTDQTDCSNSDRRDCAWINNICLPKNPPGLKFWEGQETQQICAQANAQCVVKFEKGIFGDEECSENCECLTDSWLNEQISTCNALGDCGPNTNWVGSAGNKAGYTLTK